jgi:tol-pal system protein YbgF
MKKTLFLFLALLPLVAAAQQDQTQARIDRMERDLNMLQGEFYRTKSTGKVTTIDMPEGEAKVFLQQQQQFQASMELRLTQLEDNLRQINGKLEEQEFANSQLKEEVRKLTEDMNFRVNALEKPGAAAAVTSSTSTATGVPSKGDGTKQLGTVVLDPSKQAFVNEKKQAKDLGDPKKRYDEAFDLLRQTKYPQAEKAWRSFLQDFPDYEMASSAYFWLGETFYVRQQYEPASVEYLKGYRKAPTGPKAPDNLLKLALSLSGLKKTTEACTVFEKLGKEFPHAAQPIRRKAELERTKLKCGR